MKHTYAHHGGRFRHHRGPEHHPDHPHPETPHRRDHGPGGRGRRPLDYGQIRLLLLKLIAETPRHGYELIRAVEEQFGGGYTPSPGVIYPTLAWLEDMGYATAETAEPGRKSYRLTAAGQGFLDESHAALEEMEQRIGGHGGGGRRGAPAPVLRAMENLKLALRLRLQSGPLDEAGVAAIAAAIDAAAVAVERGTPPQG